MSYNGAASRFTSFCLTNNEHPGTDTSNPLQGHPQATNLCGHETVATAQPNQCFLTQYDSTSTPPSNTMHDMTGTETIPHYTGHNNIPSAFQDSSLANQLQLLNTTRSNDVRTSLTCCCGRPSCAYWEYNNAALSGLERDLETAARLGQALLTRHESYIADSEAERKALTAKVTDLSSTNAQLQSANEAIVAENRELLAQLETLNSKLGDSDMIIKGLEATLAEAELEVGRLTVLAAKAAELEAQLIELEASRARLTASLEGRTESEQNALSRWREAEGKVKELAQDLDRVEREASLERERYAEIMARLERDKMLGSAEGRLKGAAALAGLTDPGGKGSKGVVSHFVRDILMDNGNLQSGIVELRELLQKSNDEVQNLREQIILHQPVEERRFDDQALSLEEQIASSQSRQFLSQELHVHHHYHTRISAKKDRTSLTSKRNGKKKSSIGFVGSTPDSSVPSTPSTRPQRYASLPVASSAPMVQQPTPRQKRLSVQSTNTAISTLSSLPNSPLSYFDQVSSASIFDRIEQEETSRPTSPESGAGPFAGPKPMLRLPPKSRPSEAFANDYTNEDFDRDGVAEERADDQHTSSLRLQGVDDSTELVASQRTVEKDTQLNLDLGSWEPDKEIGQNTGLKTLHEDVFEELLPPPLQRSSSHDSLVSISGMDIHLTKRKPPQLYPVNRVLHSSLLHGPSSARSISMSRPISGLAEVSASSSKRSFSGNDISQSRAMLTGLAGVGPARAATDSIISPAGGIGRLLGGWVRGKGGFAPMKYTDDLRAQPSEQTNAIGARTPGINQIGAIPGLRVPVRSPREVRVKVLDQRLLQESLAE